MTPHLVLTVAIRKLLKTSLGGAPKDDDQYLAVLSQRFGVQLMLGSQDGTDHAAHGIARHLRYCHGTTDDRRWYFHEYPSEPLLSHAAASCLHSGHKALRKALYFLLQKVESRMIDAGTSGELASRLLLLLCKDYHVLVQCDGRDSKRLRKSIEYKLTDETTDPWYIDSLDCKLPFCEQIPLLHFLEHLLGKQEFFAQDKIQQTFGKAYINFSHWILMTGRIYSETRRIEDEDEDPDTKFR